MSSVLEIPVNAEVLRLAAEEASAHQTSVEDLLGLHLRILAHNRVASLAGKTPITDGLRGILHSSLGKADRDWIADALETAVKR